MFSILELMFDELERYTIYTIHNVTQVIMDDEIPKATLTATGTIDELQLIFD